MAEMSGDEDIITKLDGTGGAVDLRTTRTQLFYEIHDPTTYLTPDVTADFSQVAVEEVGRDRVRVHGARGREWPATLKVLVGLDLGWKAVGEISYGGPGCVERARRAEEIVRRRLEPMAADIDELRIDLHGMSALFEDRVQRGYPSDVRFRVAARCRTKEVAAAVVYEVEYLYFGPAGGGGVSASVVPAVGVTPAFVPRERIPLSYEVVVS
jgi:hypothetical protein